MNRSVAWTPYSGTAELFLAAILLAVACALAWVGLRVRSPRGIARPGVCVGVAIVVVWLLSVASFVVAVVVYVLALREQSADLEDLRNPITPVTLASCVLTFVAILFLVRREGFRVAVGSAVVGTIAAPMIFEAPFDLIVMGRTFPPSPPLLYMLLYFLPLFAVEIASFAMLALSPAMRLSRTTLLFLACMFLTFAVWAMFGFAYPADPVSTGLNMIGKVLAFAVAASLFLPHRSRPARLLGVVVSAERAVAG